MRKYGHTKEYLGDNTEIRKKGEEFKVECKWYVN